MPIHVTGEQRPTMLMHSMRLLRPRASSRWKTMRPAFVALLLIPACQDGAVIAQKREPSSAGNLEPSNETAQSTQPQRAKGDPGSATSEARHPAPSRMSLPAPAPSSEGGFGASAGYADSPCPGPVFVRVRNASTAAFDSAEIDGVSFGPVRVGALSAYKQIPGCVYWYGSMRVTSGADRFLVFPIDFVGESPLESGHYTQALTTEPSPTPGVPGGLSNKISKDPPP